MTWLRWGVQLTTVLGYGEVIGNAQPKSDLAFAAGFGAWQARHGNANLTGATRTNLMANP